MTRRALRPDERGVVTLVGLALLVVGLVELVLSSRDGGPALTDPVVLKDVQIVLPRFADAPVRLSLNQASAAELESLPGVGPVLAARIVAYREEHGPFSSFSDLADVAGIGRSLVERLSELVVLDAPAVEER